MHIAFFSPAWPLAKSQNGIVTYVHWMKLALERAGHRVSVFTPNRVSLEAGVYAVGQRPLLLTRFAQRLWARRSPISQAFAFSTTLAAEVRRVARRESIDVIEMEESFGWCADVAHRTSLPMVVRLHGPAFLSRIGNESDSLFARERIEREGQALRQCTALTSPTRHTLAQTVHQYGLEPKHAVHICNPLQMHPNGPRWRLNACNRRMILFVGRFDLPKGADVVLHAFRTVLRSHPTAELTFIGPDIGLLQPNGRRLHMRDYCGSLFPSTLQGRIHYRGPLPNDEVAQLRAQAMMTVVASRWESAGYTLLEAMLQGCPVVSTDAGGCPESVVHGVTGRLARSEDPEAFATQMCAMLDDPMSAETMGEAARQYVLERNSPARVAAESLALYARMLGSSSP